MKDGSGTRSDINPVSVNLLALDHHVAKTDADAELHLTIQRQLRILRLKLGLNRNCAGDRLNHAGEFRKYAVAGRIAESAVVSFDQGISNLAIAG